MSLLTLVACGGNAAHPDGGAGSGGRSGTGGDLSTGGTVGSGGAGPGTGGAQASGGAVGSGGAQTGGQGGGQGGHAGGGGQGATGGRGQQGGAAGGQGGRGGGQGGQGGGQGGQSGNDVCASAVAQGVCTAEGTTCSRGCTDACHFCNSFRCQGGRWIAQEAAPAPCFMCGPTLLCQKNAQYCHEISGGPAGSTTTYQCRATPTACLPTPTCACLKAQTVSGADICQQSAAGELTIMVALP